MDKQISQAYAAATARDLVLAKLDKAIKYIVKTYGGVVRLDADDQYAVRILESRKRAWNREFNALYAQHERVLLRARLELGLKSKDEGELLLFANGKHGVGRLDCTACDYEYTMFDGFPVQEPMCMVCPECRAGVMHVKTIGEWPEGTVIDPLTKTSDVQPDFYHHHLCDHCGLQTKSKV